MDVQNEIRLYQMLKEEFSRAVKAGEVNSPKGLLQWLRNRLSEEQLRQDTDLGFQTAEEELAFLKRMTTEQPGLLTAIRRSAGWSDVSLTSRLVSDLAKKAQGSSKADSGTVRTSQTRSFDSFWDLMTFVEDSDMCTQPGCTTCGCMPYRNLIFGIGRQDLKRMILAATDEEVKNADPEQWYEPFRLIVYFFTEIEKLDCPLSNRYRELRDECLAAIRRRREDSLRKQEEIHLQAVARKEENRKAHEERSRAARERYYRLLQENKKEEM